LTEEDFGAQNDQSQWSEMKEKLTTVIKQKTQAQWSEIMEGTDVCFAPVLNFLDAPKHPANIARNTYIEVDGLVQPAPAPRFGRTPSEVRHGGHDVGQDTDAVLTEMGFGEQELAGLRADGSIV
jgi:alpha-methylacyl-CoA racemase